MIVLDEFSIPLTFMSQKLYRELAEEKNLLYPVDVITSVNIISETIPSTVIDPSEIDESIKSKLKEVSNNALSTCPICILHYRKYASSLLDYCLCKLRIRQPKVELRIDVFIAEGVPSSV